MADVSTSEASLLAAFVVTLSAESGKTVTVSFTASAETGDTAESPADFSGFAALGLIFNPGDLTANQAVVVVDDSIVEPDETFTVTLSNVMNAVISDATAKGTITNDDTAAETCTLNTGDLWCGVVTVGEIASGGHGFVSISGGNVGDLTDNSGDRSFTIGTSQYVVYRVAVSSFGLSFAVTRTTAEGVQSPGLLDDDRAKLHLHVDGHSASFAFSDVALSGSLGYEWSGASLDWSSTGSVTVRLREVAALSSDATLSGLTVTGGGSELVTFVSGTTTYTASVANDVDEVTVTAALNDSGASIEYLDGDDATLTGRHTSDPGHQVALAVGDDTVIKVKVTAEDGNATQTYTGDGDPGGGHDPDLHAEHRRHLVRDADRGGIHAEHSFWHLERFLHGGER